MINKAQTLDYVALGALALMWSSSFLFIKIAVQTLSPLTVSSGRMLTAALFLYLIMKIRGVSLPTDRQSWTFFALIGVIGNAVPFYLISWAELEVDSSVAAILIGSVPLSSFLIGHFATKDEKLTAPRLMGVLIGFAGIIVMIGPGALAELGLNAFSQLAIVAGGFCYVSASFIARKMPPMEPVSRAAGVLITASLVSVPICLVLDAPWRQTPDLSSLTAVLVLGIFPTAIATLLLFFVIMRAGATFVSLNNYINPVLGVAWGYLFFGEEPVSQTWGGLALITAGLIVTQLKRRKSITVS
ncbi:DMT family transporter [Sneathiella sp.]|jgi:drug/metabolite transporter (DMT)-like permease|uniref:DMT family transporter n=1 Tax=Sneathiella sp. TaxID=1964365 RepID=UPI0039E3E47A